MVPIKVERPRSGCLRPVIYPVAQLRLRSWSRSRSVMVQHSQIPWLNLWTTLTNSDEILPYYIGRLLAAGVACYRPRVAACRERTKSITKCIECGMRRALIRQRRVYKTYLHMLWLPAGRKVGHENPWCILCAALLSLPIRSKSRIVRGSLKKWGPFQGLAVFVFFEGLVVCVRGVFHLRRCSFTFSVAASKERSSIEC
jgi:hypothetical protein